jgi:hypothetical protein
MIVAQHCKKVWIISVKNFAQVDATPTGVKIVTEAPLKALKVIIHDCKLSFFLGQEGSLDNRAEGRKRTDLRIHPVND